MAEQLQPSNRMGIPSIKPRHARHKDQMAQKSKGLDKIVVKKDTWAETVSRIQKHFYLLGKPIPTEATIRKWGEELMSNSPYCL